MTDQTTDVLKDLLRHREARRVLSRIEATLAERQAARRVLGLSPERTMPDTAGDVTP